MRVSGSRRGVVAKYVKQKKIGPEKSVCVPHDPARQRNRRTYGPKTREKHLTNRNRLGLNTARHADTDNKNRERDRDNKRLRYSTGDM